MSSKMTRNETQQISSSTSVPGVRVKERSSSPPPRAFHNSQQYGAGLAGSAQRVPDNGWHLQMRSRVSTQARASLQLRSKGKFRDYQNIITIYYLTIKVSSRAERVVDTSLNFRFELKKNRRG
uniref:Uncharacterized protein n=1 Tax=Trichogramma kaykai TaxID=54128 RepID=A0ABD2XL49_9HYME